MCQMTADTKIALWLVILLAYGALIMASNLNYENTVDPVIKQVNKKVLLKNITQRLQNLRECLAKEATSEDIHLKTCLSKSFI